jgi:hypothetical protein
VREENEKEALRGEEAGVVFVVVVEVEVGEDAPESVGGVPDDELVVVAAAIPVAVTVATPPPNALMTTPGKIAAKVPPGAAPRTLLTPFEPEPRERLLSREDVVAEENSPSPSSPSTSLKSCKTRSRVPMPGVGETVVKSAAREEVRRWCVDDEEEEEGLMSMAVVREEVLEERG